MNRLGSRPSITTTSIMPGPVHDDDEDEGEETTPVPKRYSRAVKDVLLLRTELKVMDNGEDVTPKPVDSTNTRCFYDLYRQVDKFLKTKETVFEMTEVMERRTTLGAAFKVSIDDVLKGVNTGLLILYEEAAQEALKVEELECLKPSEIKVSPFIKVSLRQSDDILLYQQRSMTVPAGTDDAMKVEKENRAYEYMTKGKGRLTRKADAEAQTKSVLYKSRDVNTITILKNNVASYVSNFDMFDTYQQLYKCKSTLQISDSKTVEVITYKFSDEEWCTKIGLSPNFKLARMVTERILAGNVFKQQQRRFRNMFMPDPLAPEVDYTYKADILWSILPVVDKERLAVSCMSWCPSNGDILAVGYGVFTCAPNISPKSGYLCIWNIKNPVNPEKTCKYDISVVSVEFSPYRPQLIAIGFYNGTVAVRDITTELDCLVAISDRGTSPGYEPVMDIKWIGLDPGETDNVEPFLTVSQDGSIMKYRVINSPYLLGYTHAVLDRVEGSPEGLPVSRATNTLEACRHPQLMGLTLDPLKHDIFYVISNEGVIYTCSTNYPQQHLDLWQVHEGAVYCMEFSPWSPSLFLTCGDDWCIRIWIKGIFKPLITLTSKLCPVNSAAWSKTHSTVIIAINRKTIDIWDIRRSTLKPMSSTKLEKPHLTLGMFSNCGRSIGVGNEKGSLFMMALNDFPFPPHFQYEELESAILKALMPFPDLVTEFKSIGYFGYAK